MRKSGGIIGDYRSFHGDTPRYGRLPLDAGTLEHRLFPISSAETFNALCERFAGIPPSGTGSFCSSRRKSEPPLLARLKVLAACRMTRTGGGRSSGTHYF